MLSLTVLALWVAPPEISESVRFELRYLRTIRNNAILEFNPIVLSLYLWGHTMRNHCILFFADNESLVYVINKQSTKDKSLMFFVRKLVLICLEYKYCF